jgi:hypothetical protein
MGVLGYQGADVGSLPPSIASRSPDYGIDSSVFDPSTFSAWKNESNQEYLAEHIGNFKFGYHAGPIASCELPSEFLGEIGDCPIGKMIYGAPPDDVLWYDTLDGLLDRAKWFYLPLPECTRFDLIVFADAEGRRTLPLLSSCGYRSCVGWREGLAVWPSE